MEPDNHPVLFHEFARRAAAKGMKIVADGEFPINFPENLPPQAADFIRNFSSDPVEQGQCIDFLLNRFFRRTLLCQEHVALDRGISRERTRLFYFSSDAMPEGEVDFNSPSPATYRRQRYGMTVSNPPLKFAMGQLLKISPASIHFRDLFLQVRDRFGESDAEVLLDALPLFHRAGMIDLSICPCGFTITPSRMPLATQLARYQASQSGDVTSLLHIRCVFDELHRQVLQRLDGGRDRAAIIASMPPSAQMTPERLEAVLNHLAAQACLQG